MSCSNPINAWYSNRVNKDTGKRSLVFHPSKAFTDMPVTVPCGKCLGCRADQSLMWSIRAYHESLLHRQSCFVTLTYDEQHHRRADGLVSKSELQRWLKRLRKKLSPLKLRYIACGEYGEQSRRAHYHAILFGVDFRDARSVPITDTLYTHPVLSETWPFGLVSIAPVSFASICYVCGYVLKKMADDDTFTLMSRRPGIGKEWLDKYFEDLQRTGTVVIEGREFAIPPRYLRWREDDFLEVKKARTEFAKAAEKRHDPVVRRQRLDARTANRKSLIDKRNETL